MFGQEAKLAALINRDPPQVPNEQALVAELVAKLGPGADPDKLLFQIRSARGKTHWAVNSYLRDVMTSSAPGQEDFWPSRPTKAAAEASAAAAAAAAAPAVTASAARAPAAGTAAPPPSQPFANPAGGAVVGDASGGPSGVGGAAADVAGRSCDPAATAAPDAAVGLGSGAATAACGSSERPLGSGSPPGPCSFAPSSEPQPQQLHLAPVSGSCTSAAPANVASAAGSSPGSGEVGLGAVGGGPGGGGVGSGGGGGVSGGSGGSCLDSLPVSLLEAVFRFLDYRSLCAAAMASRAMSAAASSESLWSLLYASRWGSLVFPTEPHLGAQGPGAGAGLAAWPETAAVPAAAGPAVGAAAAADAASGLSPPTREQGLHSEAGTSATAAPAPAGASADEAAAAAAAAEVRPGTASGLPSLLLQRRSAPRCARQPPPPPPPPPEQQQRQPRTLVPDTLAVLDLRSAPDPPSLGPGGWPDCSAPRPPGAPGYRPAGSPRLTPDPPAHAEPGPLRAESPAGRGRGRGCGTGAPGAPASRSAAAAAAAADAADARAGEDAPVCLGPSSPAASSGDLDGAGKVVAGKVVGPVLDSHGQQQPLGNAADGNGGGGGDGGAAEAGACGGSGAAGAAGAAPSALSIAAASCGDSDMQQQQLAAMAEEAWERGDGAAGGSRGVDGGDGNGGVHESTASAPATATASAASAAAAASGSGGLFRLRYRRQMLFLTSLRCPRCGGGSIVPIVYGFPSPKLMEGMRARRLILGGDHLIENCHVWGCNRCGASFRHFPYDRCEGWAAELARPQPQRPSHLPHYTYEL